MSKIYHHLARTKTGERLFQAVSFREKAFTGPYGTKVKTLIKVETPGDPGATEVVMTEAHERTFGAEYAAWLEGNENAQTGTSLEDCMAFETEVINILNEQKIFTLEQLAAAPDSFCKDRKSRSWRERAQNLIDVKKSAAVITNLESDLQAAKEEIKELRGNIRAMNESLGASTEAKESQKKSTAKRAVAKKATKD